MAKSGSAPPIDCWKYWDLFQSLLDKYRPDLVAFEEPKVSKTGDPRSAWMGYVAVIELAVASRWDEGGEWSELAIMSCNTPSVRRHFIGGNVPRALAKAATIQQCSVLFGLEATFFNDDEADAVAHFALAHPERWSTDPLEKKRAA